MLVYVNDIIIDSSCGKTTAVLIDQLREEFVVNDLGELHYFLGIEVMKSNGELVLAQKKYIAELKEGKYAALQVYQYSHGCIQKLSKAVGTPLNIEEATKYRCTVGDLQYLTITRSDIFFVVNKACRFMQAPTTAHWAAVKRILRYLRYSLTYGLHIYRSI
jgi:hypothetical protein